MDPYPGVVSFHVHDDVHQVCFCFCLYIYIYIYIEDAIESLYNEILGSKF